VVNRGPNLKECSNAIASAVVADIEASLERDRIDDDELARPH
jgi:hypothetical protein